MKYQNFIMRILCLLLILAAVVGYNSMQKKDTQVQESLKIKTLTERVAKLEEKRLLRIRKQRSHRHRGMQKTKMMLQKRMRRELTLQIQKSLMIRKMYTKMVRIPVLHRDLEVRSPYRSHLQMMRSQIFR